MDSVFTCRNCGEKLDFKKLDDSAEFFNGIANCGCTSYPIVNGILVLQKSLSAKQALRYLSDGEFAAAAHILMEPTDFSNSIHDKLYKMVDKLLPKLILQRKQQLHDCLSADTFCKAVDTLNYGYWGVYLKHRFSAPSFIATIPFLNILAEKEVSLRAGAILDIGCGAGHCSYLLSKLNPQKLVCADNKFVHLLLLKKYLVPSAIAVCLDASAPLPIKTNSFDAIICTDTFHYIRRQSVFAQELKRILHEDGILVLSHLHNSVVHKTDYSKTPQQYEAFFKEYKYVQCSEEYLIDAYITDELKLESNLVRQRKALEDAEALCMLVTKNKFYFRDYRLTNSFLYKADRIALNPIYDVKIKNEYAELKVKKLGKYFSEYPLLKKYLKFKYSIQNRILANLDKIVIDDEIKSLIKSRVLITVPERY